MKIKIELTDEYIEFIAGKQAAKEAYDRLSESDRDLTEMYSIAFFDGAKYMLNLIESQRDQ